MKKYYKNSIKFVMPVFIVLFFVFTIFVEFSSVNANEIKSEQNLAELTDEEEAQAFLDLTIKMSEDLAGFNKSLSYSVLMLEASNKQSSGDFVGAIEIYTKIIDTDPKNIDAYLERGDTKIDSSQEEEGTKDINQGLILINEGLEKNPKDAQLYSARGRANKYLKNYDQAMLDVQKAIELDPSDISYPIEFKAIEAKSKIESILK